MRSDGSSKISPQVSVEVADVDAVHAEAVRRGAGVVINVLRHIPGAAAKR